MSLKHEDISKLTELEESLWRTDTRYDLNHQEKVFADDFFEFGRSGRIYKRMECITNEKTPINANIPLKDFSIRLIDKNTVLITYISEEHNDEIEVANRSSVWSKIEDEWVLRFHQGTPVKNKEKL